MVQTKRVGQLAVLWLNGLEHGKSYRSGFPHLIYVFFPAQFRFCVSRFLSKFYVGYITLELIP